MMVVKNARAVMSGCERSVYWMDYRLIDSKKIRVGWMNEGMNRVDSLKLEIAIAPPA